MCYACFYLLDPVMIHGRGNIVQKTVAAFAPERCKKKVGVRASRSYEPMNGTTSHEVR